MPNLVRVSSAGAFMPDPSFDKWVFLARVVRRRKAVLISTAAIALVSVVVSLLLPNWYAATTSLLPPEKAASPQLGAVLGGAFGSAAGSGAGESRGGDLAAQLASLLRTRSDLIAGILRSRRLREEVIERTGLIDVYKARNLDDALETFADRIRIRVGPEGIVRLRILDKDPQRAARVAQSCLEVLDEILSESERTTAREVLAFIDERMKAVQATLSAAEESLLAFQKRFGFVAPKAQADAVVGALAELEARRVALEMELGSARKRLGPEHPEVARLEGMLASLREARRTLEGSWPSEDGRGEAGGFALPDLRMLAGLNLEYLRLYRELRVQETVFELLKQMREYYAILEVRDTPALQILDPPRPPQEKDRPHRGLICATATVLGFLLTLLVAGWLERLEMLAEENPERLMAICEALRGLGLGFLVRGQCPRGRNGR